VENIEVTARFSEDGKVTPLSFRWNGSHYPVEGTGRRWNADDGLHILVMAAGGKVFELLFSHSPASWYIRPVAPSRNII
jgi:hypothetical protein